MKYYKNNILREFVNLKNMTRISIYLIICNLLFFSKITLAKSVLDVISKNKDLTTFNSYLEKTGLDRVLEKNFLGTGQFLLQVTRLLRKHPSC